MYEIFSTKVSRGLVYCFVFVLFVLSSGFFGVSSVLASVSIPNPITDMHGKDSVVYSDTYVFYFNQADVMVFEQWSANPDYIHVQLSNPAILFNNCTPVRVDCSDEGSFDNTYFLTAGKNQCSNHSEYWYDTCDPIEPDPEFQFDVLFPDLDVDLRAVVQPDNRFYLSLTYAIPAGYDYDDIRFSIVSCDVEDCTGSNYVLGTDTLASIRSSLGSAEGNKIFYPVPVVNGESRYYAAKLSDLAGDITYIAVRMVLIGSDSSLIAPGAALDGAYTGVPNILTNPSGFVSALLENSGTFVVNAIIPPPGYLTDKMVEFTSAWSIHQPGLVSINTAFSDGIASLSTPTSLSPVAIGALHIGGTTTSSITFFDPSTMPSGIFDTAKTLISAFMYFGVAFWVLREMSTILSA